MERCFMPVIVQTSTDGSIVEERILHILDHG